MSKIQPIKLNKINYRQDNLYGTKNVVMSGIVILLHYDRLAYQHVNTLARITFRLRYTIMHVGKKTELLHAFGYRKKNFRVRLAFYMRCLRMTYDVAVE